MSYVIAEPCIGSKDRSCVEVCPVDCIYENADSELNKKANKEPAKPGDYGMLVIHPDECIHCGACSVTCPVGAIFEDDDLPEQWEHYKDAALLFVKNHTDEELEKLRVTVKS